MVEGKERVRLEVDAGLKRDWNEHVEQSDSLNSLSELIRLSVAQYIADEESENDGSLEAQEDILRSIEEVRKDIDDLTDKVRVVKQNQFGEDEVRAMIDEETEEVEAIVEEDVEGPPERVK